MGKIKESKCQNSTEEKGKKHDKLKKDILLKDVPNCPLVRNIATNFHQSSNTWEVECNTCNGEDCSINFGIEKCTPNNVVWICEGLRHHICKIVYCSESFFSKKEHCTRNMQEKTIN